MDPGESPPCADASAARLLALIAGMVRELHPGTERAAVGLDDAIETTLGLDSVSRVELLARIEQSFGLRLPEQRVAAARTPRDLLDAIAAAHGAPLAGAPVLPLPEAVVGTPERATTMLEAYCWHLEHHPEREQVRLIDADRTLASLTYVALWQSAGGIAAGLEAAGVGRGDTVALMLPTGAAFFEAMLGTLRRGAVPVPLYPPWRWSDIGEHVRSRAAILANAQARLLVTVPEASFVGRIIRAEQPWLRGVVSVEQLRGGDTAAALPPLAGRDLALLQYTSGSTGDPKGVMLAHDNLLANIRAMGRAAAASSRDRFVSWLPLYHDMGLIGAWFGTLYHAIPLILMSPATFLARPATWLQAIARHRATISAGPNFAYEIAATRIRDEDLEGVDLASWRLAFNGAEPVRAATLERFAARYARYGFDRRALTPVYGLAESAVGLAFPPLQRGPLVEAVDGLALAHRGEAAIAGPACPAVQHVVSCGRPLPDHEIRVVDAAGRELPERVEGRVEFRGPSATAGYYRNPAATARLLDGDWRDTGDVGYVGDGELYLTSRAKDLIKRGGHAIHPYDLEAAIGDVPGIRKGCVAVFGSTDAAHGSERVIVVAETARTDPAGRQALHHELVRLAATHLDGPADDVLLVPPRTLLKTSSGKIRRAACRERYERGSLTTPQRAAWLQLAALVARANAAKLGRSAAALRRIAYATYAWLMLASVAVGCLVRLAIARDPPARYAVAHQAAATLARRCRIALTLEGREHLAHAGPAVIVANHASYVDALALVAILETDVRFAAKRELARAPVLGWALRRLGTHFVDRVDAAGGIEDTRGLAAAVRRGERILVFPEGTFTRAAGLAGFHLGAFVVSAEAGVPVVPVVLKGTRSVLRASQWQPRRHPVAVCILPPVLPDGHDWSAAVRLRDRVRAQMLERADEPDLAR